MSNKVSVDSIDDADADDVLIAFIGILFRQNSVRSWLVFGAALLIPSCLTIACSLDGRYLTAAVFSTTALILVLCRIFGLSHEKPTEPVDQSEELQAHT